MASKTEENKKIVESFFESLSSGTNSYLDYYTNDSEIWTAGQNAIGGRRTKAEIESFADGILSAFPKGIRFEITSMIAEDDRVAAEVKGDAIHASGQIYQNEYHFLIRLKNNKIIELKEYMDTQLAAKVLLGE
tara:strand:+ start:467 stop:865 length:399 start_codon:yes stop_codon:yes gene_type:complete